MQNISGSERQKEIYLNGVRGKRPSLALDYLAIREFAKRKLSKEAFDYVDGGAGREQTILANEVSINSWCIKPKMMRGIQHPNISTHYLNKSFNNPFFLCPIGVLEMLHRQADVAVARAASAVDVPLMISNQASRSMEQIATATQAPIFFQLYWSKSDELVQSFLTRAKNSGCLAIVVTLDTVMLGWRARDLRNAFLPFLYSMGMAQYTSDPVFRSLVEQDTQLDLKEAASRRPNLAQIRSLLKMSRNFPGSTWHNFKTQKPLAFIKKFINIFMRPSLDWSDLSRLRKMTSLPIVLKGIQCVDDAHRAIDAGVEGIIVSNHGGRQIDGAIGSLDALANIGAKVGDKIDLFFDSGIRSGADAFKALALGAKAVGIGRPYAFALGTGGKVGVQELLKNYLAELELTMVLSGCENLEQINRTFLSRNHAIG